MNKVIKKIFIAIIVLIVSINPINLYADYQEKDVDRVLKVGFYSYKPYYFINDKGKPDGYYNDILELLSKDLDLKYEYVLSDFSTCLEKLEDGEIDLLVGLHYTRERAKKYIYTDNYIGVETHRIYTNKDIEYGSLEDLNGLRFAFIENEVNSQWILKLMERKNINLISVMTRSYEEAIKLLETNQVDATIAPTGNTGIMKSKKIYEFSLGTVYICGSKENEEIIKKIDKILDKYGELEKTPIQEVGAKYFYKEYNKYKLDKEAIRLLLIITFILVILCLIIIYKNVYPNIRKKKIRKLIRDRMNKYKYLLYYQPIVNPKVDSIVGFEALLRLIDFDGTILSPNKFIKEIEENDMMFDVSIWALNKAIKDYKLIRQYNNMEDREFYISVNISFKEIENERFIEQIRKVLLENDMDRNTICLEIVESVGINDFSKIQKAIKELKESGFIIAIDDFGVEYSNLDILAKLDFDIIKLDKYFVDNVEKSKIRIEIMEFLSNLSVTRNKVIVAEGVEVKSQKDIIKNINHEKFYIQGYFYSSPLSIEKLKYINLK